MKIVGLVGPKRSGKDTAAAALVEQREYMRIGFADAVKDMALRIDPIVHVWGDGWRERLSNLVGAVGWERAKDELEVRRFLQALGTDGVRDIVGPDTWAKIWQRKAYAHGEGFVVATDVRFLNEENIIRTSAPYGDTLLIRLHRPGLDLSDTHASETEQLKIRCDVELTNDGTTEQLHAKVLAAVDGWFTS